MTRLRYGGLVCCLTLTALAAPPAALGNVKSGPAPTSRAQLHVPSEYSNIQAAIDAATDGDEVVLADGGYEGDGNTNLDFRGKSITVRSASGDPATCEISGWDQGRRGFWFHSGETSAAVVYGISIASCSLDADAEDVPDARGAGILCSNRSSPTLSNCIIHQCTSGGSTMYYRSHMPSGGGGLACLDHSSPTLIDCTISDCGLRDSYTGSNGAGMLCDDGSCPSLTRCTIEYCWSESLTTECQAALGCLNGSNARLTDCSINNNNTCGVYCQASDSVFERCTITANTEYSAGGLYLDHSSPALRGCTLAGNSGWFASAILCEWYSYPELTDCRIAGGGPWRPGDDVPAAIVCRAAAAPVVASCLIDDPGGIWAQSYAYPVIRNSTLTGPVVSSYSSDALLVNSIIWSTPLHAYTLAGAPAQLSVSYCDVQGGQPAVQVDPDSALIWGEGNIDVDPGFVDPDGPDDSAATWEDNDYHLSAGSACINAGTPGFAPAPDELDIDGHLRVWDGRVDIGADEFGAPRVDELIPGDLNCDGAVNVFDIDPFVLALTAPATYAARYPSCSFLLADVNDDGLVNTFDIDPFVSHLVGSVATEGE